MSISVILAAMLIALSGSAVVMSVRSAQAGEQRATREIEIVVDGGYKPDRIDVTEGEAVRLKFLRKDYSSCTAEVVFPSLGIKRSLPTNQPVAVDLPALKPGEVEFRCGMNMIRGKVVVHAKEHAQH